MFYTELPPGDALSAYVAHYWILVSKSDDAFDPEILLPDVACHLIFSPGKKPYVIGARTRTMQVRPSGNGHCVYGVKFKPGGFHSLFHTSPADVTNSIIDAQELDIWQHDHSSNLDILLSVKGHFDTLLTSYLKRAKAIDHRVVFASGLIEISKGSIDIKSIREQCFISERQFERRFKEHAGVSAKKYAQLIRFNHLLEHMLNKTEECFSSLAYNLGYYDEAHLSHDLQKLTGTAPGQFLERYKMSVLYKANQ